MKLSDPATLRQLAEDIRIGIRPFPLVWTEAITALREAADALEYWQSLFEQVDRLNTINRTRAEAAESALAAMRAERDALLKQIEAQEPTR
jgi:hypothetical protein